MTNKGCRCCHVSVCPSASFCPFPLPQICPHGLISQRHLVVPKRFRCGTILRVTNFRSRNYEAARTHFRFGTLERDNTLPGRTTEARAAPAHSAPWVRPPPWPRCATPPVRAAPPGRRSGTAATPARLPGTPIEPPRQPSLSPSARSTPRPFPAPHPRRPHRPPPPFYTLWPRLTPRGARRDPTEPHWAP